MKEKEIDPLIKIQAWITAYNTVEAERHARLVEMVVADHMKDFAQKLSKSVRKQHENYSVVQRPASIRRN